MPWICGQTKILWCSRTLLKICGVISTWRDNHQSLLSGFDMLANEVEIGRLMEMGVLIKEELYPSEVTDSLTTKFVHDWRAKDYAMANGEISKRWFAQK